MALAVVFALVTQNNLKKLIASGYAHAIVLVPGQLLKEWHFAFVSNSYKQFHLLLYFPKLSSADS